MTSSRPKHEDVALRKESVDRNSAGQPAHGLPSIVALRKESVDRNGGANIDVSCY